MFDCAGRGSGMACARRGRSAKRAQRALAPTQATNAASVRPHALPAGIAAARLAKVQKTKTKDTSIAAARLAIGSVSKRKGEPEVLAGRGRTQSDHAAKRRSPSPPETVERNHGRGTAAKPRAKPDAKRSSLSIEMRALNDGNKIAPRAKSAPRAPRRAAAENVTHSLSSHHVPYSVRNPYFLRDGPRCREIELGWLHRCV